MRLLLSPQLHLLGKHQSQVWLLSVYLCCWKCKVRDCTKTKTVIKSVVQNVGREIDVATLMLSICFKKTLSKLSGTQHFFCLWENMEWLNFSSLTNLRLIVYNLEICLFFSPYWLECLRNERMTMGSKVYRRQMCMSPVHREAPKTNGHSLSVPTSITPDLHTTPRLGRPLNLKSHGTSRYFFYIAS